MKPQEVPIKYYSQLSPQDAEFADQHLRRMAWIHSQLDSLCLQNPDLTSSVRSLAEQMESLTQLPLLFRALILEKNSHKDPRSVVYCQLAINTILTKLEAAEKFLRDIVKKLQKEPLNEQKEKSIEIKPLDTVEDIEAHYLIPAVEMQTNFRDSIYGKNNRLIIKPRKRVEPITLHLQNPNLSQEEQTA
jgi:hypothetical protein